MNANTMGTTTRLMLILVVMAIGYVCACVAETTIVWDEDRRLGVHRPDAALADVLATITASSGERVESGVPSRLHSTNDSSIRFKEADDTGVDFAYQNGGEQFHLAETLGGGVGATDFDRDGLPDIVFVDGGDPITWPDQSRQSIVLFQQCQRMKFELRSTQAGLSWSGYGHGVSVGDVDNDGFDDLFVSGYQSMSMCRNMGDGTFEEANVSSITDSSSIYATAAFGDLDSDGDLDLYVTGYADVPRSQTAPWCEEDGKRIHCNPHHFPVISDLLFENNGDWTFTDRSQTSGVAAHKQYGLGVVMVDLDYDRTPEVFVANDGDRNLLFRSLGNLQFEETATVSGVAYNGEGQSMGAMGIACADFDRNGWLDVMTTNFYHERNVIFSNTGELQFYDRSRSSVIADSSRAKVGWAAIPIDGDGDGNTDLFVANGHVTDSPSAAYAQTPLFYQGSTDAGLQLLENAGAYFNQSWHGRGAVKADIDQDLQPDLVISHVDAPASILLNQSAKDAAPTGFTLCLIGVSSNRSASTTRVTVTTPRMKQTDQRILSSGYLSSSTCSMQFGLGTDRDADQVLVEWQSGVTQTLENVPAGARVTLIEGHEPLVE